MELNNLKSNYVVFTPRTYLEQVKIIIILRWLAVAGVIILILAGKLVFKLGFNPIPVIMVNLSLIILNLYYTKKIQKYELRNQFDKQELGLSSELLVDQLLLTVILVYVGGITNPFSTIYFYDTLISALLLSRNHCILHTIFSLLMIGTLSIMEYVGFVCDRCQTFTPHAQKGKVIFITWFAMSFTVVVISAIMIYLMDIYRKKVDDLNLLNDILKKTQEDKSNFYRVAAHEMKSPVTGIRTLLQTARHIFSKEIPPKLDDFILKAEKRAVAALDKIKDLLQMSVDLPGSENFQLRRFSLDNIIDEVISNEFEKFSEKDLKLVRDYQTEDFIVEIDVDSMVKVFTNLITNAVRYSDANKTIIIRSEKIRNNLCVSIIDQGIGIPESEIDKIGKDFYRASNAKQFSTDGTGLGMAISFSIVRRHGGDIKISSEINKGSTFSVFLPYPK
ncbi:MAG: HAMP domain-containing histidine kinase [Candidatus Delongbacteria bacterium]|nr:HAMP domain-containing histidine kinase [Candidatus Delongbacteria bacterium]MBN2836501.1 HAMP domain-containing histidine kinase [Candidatus Delongbacteria bacterium]